MSAGLRAHGPLLVVFLAYALTAAFVVPTFAPVATTDDWAYTRSAQILLAEGRLTIFPVVAATSVVPIAWGALFGFLFGPTFGAFRLSTVVITALGALALYALCRDLGVSPRRGALGVAAYLFNPLVFVLAFTFMTDAHFVALLVLATWAFARALTPDRRPEGIRPPPASRVPGPGEGRVTPRWGGNGPELRRQPSPLSLRTGKGRQGGEGSPGAGVTEIATINPPINPRLILLASTFSALAFLTRQQGALIVPAVIGFLLLTRRLRFDRASLTLLVQLVAPLALAMAGYALWLRYGNDVPRVQVSFFREMLEEGWSGTWWLLRRLTVVELIYLGLFTLPLMAALLPVAREVTRGIVRRGWLLFAVWAGIATAGVVTLWLRGARMPYVAQFFGAGGLGPPDVVGSRPILLTPEMRGALTLVCLIASLLLGLVAARAVSLPDLTSGVMSASPLQDARAGLVLCIGLGQVIGVLPPSYHYIGWAAGSLDRYLLPLVPLAIALALWGVRGVRLALPVGWAVAIAMALFAVAGTRDYLVFMREVWAMGDRAVAAGVPLIRLDAGSGWDGYHLYEYGRKYGLRSRTPKGGPWWVYFYAPATDSAYVVAGKPRPGYIVVARRPYSSWLLPRSPNLFLLRRQGEPWPPHAYPVPIVRAGEEGLQVLPAPWKPPRAAMPTVSPDDGLSTASESDDE